MQTTTKYIANGAITNPKLANMNSQTVKANITPSSTSPSDVAMGILTGWDAIVGTGGTHADINAVMSDANIANIRNVLIISSLTINTTQTISQDNMTFVFKPNVTWTAGAATVGITLSANAVNIIGGRLTGFTTGISIGSGKKNNLIQNVRSLTNTTGISDSGTNTTLSANIEEV